MDIRSNTIFSKTPGDMSSKTNKDIEDNKVSYWLKKLFDQRAQKVIDDKKMADKKSASQPKYADNNEHNLNLREKSSELKGREDVQVVSEIRARDKRLTDGMVRKSNREVLTIYSVFPFDIFPSAIRVQENKVSFIFHQFLSSQEQDVDIRDISNIHIDLSFFFARLKVVSNTFSNHPVIIGHLKKKEAQLVRMYIQGLQLFTQKNIDTSNYEIKELKQKLEELQANKYN